MKETNETELRAGGHAAARAGQKITGTAVVYSQRSQMLGGAYGFTESISPGAFTDSLGSADLVMLADHDASKVLGRQSAGTLEVTDGPNGLDVCCESPDTSYARDLLVSLARRDICGMSFGFVVEEDIWSMGPDGKTPHRTVTRAEIVEVSVVTFPAYPQTSAAARSRAEARRQNRDMVLFQDGLDAAKDAVSADRVEDGEWSFAAEDGDRLLGTKGNDWNRYGQCFLAEVTGEAADTKDRWAYPWGKLVDGKITLFTRAVSAALARSADGHPAIHAAAQELKKLLDDRGSRQMEWAELEQRLTE